jgi:hypothetical protein
MEPEYNRLMTTSTLNPITLEAQIVRRLQDAVPEGAGDATARRTAPFVASARSGDPREQLGKVESLANHLRSALCSRALRRAGMHVEADQLTVRECFDPNRADACARQLRDYGARLRQLTPPSPHEIEYRRAGEVLDATADLLDLLADSGASGELTLTEQGLAAQLAANALAADFGHGGGLGLTEDDGVGLPDTTTIVLYQLQTIRRR